MHINVEKWVVITQHDTNMMEEPIISPIFSVYKYVLLYQS